jgi:hypothetical protein
MLKGRVRSTTTGLIKTLIRPKTQAAMTAVERESTLMPGINCEASRIATVMINHLVIITNI